MADQRRALLHDKVALQQRIQALRPWFHNMWLGGVRTEPEHFLGDYPEVKFRHFRDLLPADMRGMSVLDIGCNAGFYSLEMKQRGATRVLGIDSDERYLQQARLAAEVRGLDISFEQLSIWEIGALEERFDLVIFMGVLYHLRHPLLALDLIHEHVAKDKLLFQSMQRGSRETRSLDLDFDITDRSPFDHPAYPLLHFIEHRYAGDATNWWIPNKSCVEAMLRSSGFIIDAQPEDETYLCHRTSVDVPADGPHCVYPAQARKHVA